LELCMSVAPVEVHFNPSNHAFMLGIFFICGLFSLLHFPLKISTLKNMGKPGYLAMQGVM